jgi:hypothetical protein
LVLLPIGWEKGSGFRGYTGCQVSVPKRKLGIQWQTFYIQDYQKAESLDQIPGLSASLESLNP